MNHRKNPKTFYFKSFAYIEMEFDRFEQASGWDFTDFSLVRVKRLNKTARAIFGILQQKVAADDTHLVSFELSLKQGGQYRKLPYKLPPKGFCSFINEDIYIYPELSKASDIPWPLSCPLPIVNVHFSKTLKSFDWKFKSSQKNYTIDGYIPSIKNLPVKYLMSGDYMIENFITKDGAALNSFKMFGSLINLDRTWSRNFPW